jgi:hypothetical protein
LAESGGYHYLVSSSSTHLWRAPRSLGLSAVGVVICLTFAGCDNGLTGDAAEAVTSTSAAAPGTDPDREVIAAVDATLAAPSFTMSTVVDLTTGPRKSHLVASGSVDLPLLIVDMAVSLESGSQKGESETRANGTNVWVRAENDGVNELDLPDGKLWVEGEAARLTELTSFDQGTLDLLGVLLTLRAADGTEMTGTDSLDNTKVTRYRTSLTYEDAVAAAGPDTDALKQALSLEAETPVILNIDVAIGSDGVIREFVLTSDTGSDADSAGLVVDYRASLTNVGLAVDAPEPPPRDETVTGRQAETILDGRSG